MTAPPPGFVLDAPRTPRRKDEDEDRFGLPEGFVIDQPAASPAPQRSAPPPGFVPDAPQPRATGQAIDGDTIKLTDGRNARLLGYDAFERNQTGRARDNSVVPLGQMGRSRLTDYLPGVNISNTGQVTYGRPVVTLDQNGVDPGRQILREGLGLAAPDYLKGQEKRLADYMEAERLARLNRLGAHGGKFETPQQYRKQDGPWKSATPAPFGEGEAVFWDEPTPFQGLRPEIAQGYLAVVSNPQSTKNDILAYAKQHGFTINESQIDGFLKKRAQPNTKVGGISYADAPQLVTDPGDGRLGAALRGFGDPINMLDEMGGLVDTFGGTGGRENVWNSDRRFGDILWNNIDQNRSILAYDDQNYPYTRFGGQMASGVLLPGGSAQGVGRAAATAAMRSGASRLAAQAAARSAVTRRLALAGAVEGGLAGAGQAEGGIVERLPGALVGAATGATLGYGAGELGQTVVGTLKGRKRPPMATGAANREFREAQPPARSGPEDVAPSREEYGQFVNRLRPELRAGAWAEYDAGRMGRLPDGDPLAQSAPSPAPGIAEMRDEIGPEELLGPRVADRIDIEGSPPPPDGYVLDEPTFGRTRQLMDRPTPAEMANIAEGVEPRDMIPIRGNQVQSMEEAAGIGDGMRPLLTAPDEYAGLQTRYTPSQRAATRQLPHKGPLDMVSWLRTQGGLKPTGELSVMGITNEPRAMDFAQGERRMGRLVDAERGLSLDEAADRAWRAGYMPGFNERPTIDDFLGVLGETHSGSNRSFLTDDLPEVERFYQAQDERYRIMQADQDGAPLADDLGQPITQADLDGNMPPIEAYEEWGVPGGPNIAGNIDLTKLDTPGDINRALAMTGVRMGDFDAARRGRITQAETERLAAEMGMTPDQLLRRRQGQALNAEQALGARQILAKSGNELVALARRTQGGSDEDLASFRSAWLRHAAIQEQVSGMTAEAGRALAQFRMVAKSSARRDRILPNLTQMGGGRDKIEEAARMILDLENAGATPGQINSFALKATKPRWKDKALEVWYNSLLSGPQTHAVNILSNTVTAALQIPEQVAASAIGQIRRRNSVDRVMASEIAPRVVGLLQGAREGLRAFGYTLKTGNVPDHVTKVEARVDEAIPGMAGKVIRVPTRLLAAEDEFFKAAARRMELSGLAMRKARAEGLRGDALYKRVADLSANPPDDMLDRSLDYARYLTFQQPLGRIGQGAMNLTSNVPELKLFVPFIRTPTNIIKFAAERSLFAPFLKEWRQDILAKGARRDVALARVALGTGLAAMVTQWAKDGAITGSGPVDENSKNLMRADGWQPYSIRVGDQYISYQRMDPLSLTLGMAADYASKGEYMTDGQRENAATVLGAAFLSNLKDKTWLSGLSDLMEAIDDPQRSFGRVTSRLAGSMAVPALVSQTARTIDPVQRVVRDPIDAIKNRIPGMSQSLPAQTDVWGEPIVREGSLGPDILSPIWTDTIENDPLNREMLDIGARFGRLPRDKPHRLTDEEYEQFKALAGSLTAAAIRQAMETPEYQRASKAEREDMVDKIKTDQRKAARNALFGQPPKASPKHAPEWEHVLPPGVTPPPDGFILDR